MNFDENPTGANRQRYNVYESYGNLFSVVNRGVPRPPRRGCGQTRSRQGYQTARVETKRRIEGAKTTVGIDAMIKSTLHPGAKSSDDLLSKIGENHTLKAITLTITTRGIGLVLEAKLENLKTAYPLPARDTELAYPYQVDADLLHVAQTVTIAPEPIKRLINAVGIINYDEGVYIPNVSRAATDLFQFA
ncbi:unnamed protein product [Parnassius mnemosyne]|uniref:Uncharacterized protein n=1 Tax=Parnassius mnemosyne TaxID=213953 RepID=A0AAV1LCD1_9NEOP